MRVAIVDDEWYGLDLTYRLLTQIRRDLELVAFFQDPKEALDKIPMLRPNLIILDVEMPFLNGFEMYDRLEGLHAKFWMVSAHGDAFVRSRGWNDNVGFLTKPFCKSDMTDLLNSMGWATAADHG